MATRSDYGTAIRCHLDAGTAPAEWELRVNTIRYRFLLGEYDSDHVVTEVARRILGCSELEHPQWAMSSSPQRNSV
ncbi:MAG TPA: hypothetical protein VJ717_04430 [Gemmatimonadaceae bacterium]|nr:hypothetical protein [Gemmatimonadaceae bacterium]